MNIKRPEAGVDADALVATLRGALEERRKELDVLHRAALLLLDESVGDAAILQELARLVPLGFRFPVRTVARIRVGDEIFGVEHFPADARQLRVPFSCTGAEGWLEVGCCRDSKETGPPAFLAEEEALAASLARLVGASLRRHDIGRQLEGSERRFRALFENEVDCVKVLDGDRRLVEINPAGLSILGQESRDLLPGANLDGFIHPDDLPEYRRLHREAMRGRTVRGRYRVIGSAGDVRFLESVDMPIPCRHGIKHVLSITSDLTRLVQEEEKFRHVLDSSPDAMVITDSRGVIRVVNRVCETVFGYTRYELVGQTVDLLLPERLRDMHKQQREKYARKPRVRAMGTGLHLKGRRKSGIEFPVEIALGPIHSGNESLVCATVRDLTGVREFESAMKEMADTVALFTGQAHQEALVKFLSSHFGLDIALVGMVDESGRNVDTIAIAENGKLLSNMSYPLEGTPCARVIEEDSCFHDDGIQEIYPDDRWFAEVGAHGYAGVRLHDTSGKTIGVVSAISRRPLPNIHAVESFFKLASARASAELDRMQQIEAVQESELRYSLAESGTADGLWDQNLVTGKVYYSPRVADLLGLSHSELQDTVEDFWKRVHPDDVLEAREARHNHFQQNAPFDLQFRVRHGDGTYRWFRTRGKVLRDSNGQPARFTGSLTDISEGKRYQQQLKAENTWLAKFAEGSPLLELLEVIVDTSRQVFEGASLHLWLLDGESHLHLLPQDIDGVFSATKLQGLLGALPDDGLVVEPGSSKWPVEDERGFDRMRVWSLAAQEVPQRIGVALSWPRGVPEQSHERHFVSAARRLIGLALDDLRKEAELERQRLLFENLFDSAPEAMVVLDRDDRVLDVNSSFTRLFQYTGEQARGHGLNDLIVPAEFDQEGTKLSEQALLGSTVSRESFRRRKDGTLVPVSILGAPVTVSGIDAAYFAVYRDQRSLHEATQRLDFQSRHDQLTGLPNRYEFERKLQQAINLSGDAGAGVGVVYFDLDQFKVVNDSAGHTHGDELLVEVSRRLDSLVPPPNVLARLGGDEFAVLIVNGRQQECDELARDIREKLSGHPFQIHERTFVISASFGVVAVQPKGIQDAHDILSLADSACFLAKERGRNRVQVYDPADMGVARRQEELDWVSRLNEALAEDRFQLYYQRIEPVAGDQHSQHYEILLRMLDRDGNHVPPGVFIPPAERYNMMPRVDRWVLEMVFSRLQNLDEASQRNLVASINISGNTLSDEGLPDFVSRLFEKHAVLSSCICFEITETAAIGNFEDALNFIDTVRRLGCQIALDDFGSGLSSFRYLKQIAPDYLKIDGSFIREIAHNTTDYSMVEAINRIGKTIGISTVAEFVEDAQILAALRRIGVDYAQGYGLHRPGPWLLHPPLKISKA